MALSNDLLNTIANDAYHPLNDSVICKLCQGNSVLFGTVDFNKSCNNYKFSRSNIAVHYFRCDECDLIFTDFCDSWTGEQFSRFIYNDEYVLVDPDYLGSRARNDAVIYADIFAPAKRLISILDYGGGMGVFAQSLREMGFDHVATYDPFTNPTRPEGKFDVVTAFEVIEHSARPLWTLDDLLSLVADGGCLIVGQSMQPPNIADLRCDWWYVAPRNGHITFYSHRTLEKFAASRGLVYRYTTKGSFVLHGLDISPTTQMILDSMKPSVQFLRIGAPAKDSAGWHSIESDGSRLFRWTGLAETVLGELDFVEGRNYITLSTIMTIEPCFLDMSSLKIGTDLVPLVGKDGQLTAHYISPMTRRCWVSLVTPHPIKPKFINQDSADERELGLALSI
ncbi:class I SAM-dependent methyltransferase [Silvimonas sp.]|uniref:class I SAM-dependent methyltransferase n=1 Tax=Silvimonas sp. TaxID=2650811 RepID=UPI002841F2E4|nr:class I SAM-dependent methyltransferase [Silvimonas sp.]MDR3429572.1 class I SAM-dependent methyltransferase [Silvimonas sp.]